MCDTVTVVLGDIILLAFEKILDLFFWGAQKNCIFTTAQISVYNCTKFFTTAQSVHNCTLKKTLRRSEQRGMQNQSVFENLHSPYNGSKTKNNDNTLEKNRKSYRIDLT